MSENKHYQGELSLGVTTLRPSGQAGKRSAKKRANSLDGATWTRHSISIWSDIKKTKEEIELGHPAIFPVELPRMLTLRLLDEHEVNQHLGDGRVEN